MNLEKAEVPEQMDLSDLTAADKWILTKANRLAAEVTEKKKGAIGVRGIRLKKDDALTDVYLFEEGTECKISYHEKEVTLNRLKLAKRDGTGTKYRG